MKCYVYMLECSDGSFYVGSTNDLAARLFQHDEGLGATYTRRRRPVRLVWSEESHRIDDAFGRESRSRGGAARSASR